MADNEQERFRMTLAAIIEQSLAEKDFAAVLENLKLLALAGNTHPESAEETLKIMDRLPGLAGNEAAIDMSSAVLEDIGDGNGLREKIATRLLLLSYGEGLNAARAAGAAWRAADSLAPESPAGQAAIDRVLDIVRKPVEEDPSLSAELRLDYIRAALDRAEPQSTLAEKSARLWLDRLSALNPAQQFRDLRAMAGRLDPGTGTHDEAAHEWANAVRREFHRGGLDAVLPEITTVITNPQTAGALEVEANAWWVRALKECYKESFERALLVAAATSNKLAEINPNPGDCRAIKEIVAESLMTLAENTVDIPLYHFEAVMAAADYASGTAALHERIAEALVDIIQDEERYSVGQIAAANRELGSHNGYGPSPPQSRQPPFPPPAPGPG